ncbi:MAG: hypothetical protein JWQ60_6161, partial [Pseudonocardia sp.]|nr:hypothetical protein [Pseudonocardia sp.]
MTQHSGETLTDRPSAHPKADVPDQLFD